MVQFVGEGGGKFGAPEGLESWAVRRHRQVDPEGVGSVAHYACFGNGERATAQHHVYPVQVQLRGETAERGAQFCFHLARQRQGKLPTRVEHVQDIHPLRLELPRP